MTLRVDEDDDRNWTMKGHAGPSADRLERAKTGRMGARRLGGLHEITVGCRVWARTEGDVADIRLDYRGDPAGGIVLEIVDRTSSVDEETGEIVQDRSFRCFNPYIAWEHSFTVIPERCVEPDACETSDPHLLARIARLFADRARQHKGPTSDSEARLYRDAAHLAAITLGGTV